MTAASEGRRRAPGSTANVYPAYTNNTVEHFSGVSGIAKNAFSTLFDLTKRPFQTRVTDCQTPRAARYTPTRLLNGFLTVGKPQESAVI